MEGVANRQAARAKIFAYLRSVMERYRLEYAISLELIELEPHKLKHSQGKLMIKRPNFLGLGDRLPREAYAYYYALLQSITSVNY